MPSRGACLGLALFTLSASFLASAEERTLETITVTAEKRSENLQELPQAVTALADHDLDTRNITSFVDLSAIAPGVTVAKNEGFRTVISIRGIGNEANQNAIANPSVSYHLDGIYVASGFALHADFLDIERIEVLRGPQGTLFGQNSTGGALNVVSRAPETETFGGRADVAFGNHGLVRPRASVNLPLSNNLAARISAASHRHDGFGKNIALDQELDEADSRDARARLRWTPSDRLEVNFTAQFHTEDTNGAAQKGILDSTPNPRRLRQDSRGAYELDSRLFALVATVDLPRLTMQSLTSYQDDDIFIRRDNDRHDLASLPPFALVPAVINPWTSRQKTRTQEFHFISAEPIWGRVDLVAGVFFLDTSLDILIREYLDFGFDGQFDPITVEQVRAYAPGDYGFISDSRPKRVSRSLYGQGNYHVNDRTRLTAGLRHTMDDVRSAVTNFFGRAGTDNLAIDGTALTGRVAVERDMADASMMYASYTRGHKPGGSNLTYGRENVIAPVVVLPIYNEETVNAFEFGMKADIAARAVRWNAAVFYYNYKNLQYQATDPEVFEGGVGNIPKARSFGAELEFLAFLSDRLTLDARLAWIRTEITGRHLALDNVRSDEATNTLLAAGLPLFGPQIQQARARAITDVNGNKFAKTPGFTADVMLRHTNRLGAWGELTAGLQYTHRGKFQHRIFNNPKTDRVPSYDVFNLTFALRPNAADWQVEVLFLNVKDIAGVNARFTDVFGVGATSEELIPPRQIMARAGVAF